MLRISVFLILYFAQGTLFAQSQTIFDSVGVHSNKVFLQFGYFEDNSLVEDRFYEKISGFKSTKLGLIRYYSEKSVWGYNLTHFKGQNSYTDSLDFLVIYSDGSVTIETREIISQEELAFIGMDISYYRTFLSRKKFSFGAKCSAGYSHKRRKTFSTFQVNKIYNSLGVRANLFSMYKLNDRFDLYMDLNLLQYNLVVRNIQFIDGDIQRNVGTVGYGEFNLLGKSIARIHIGFTYNF